MLILIDMAKHLTGPKLITFPPDFPGLLFYNLLQYVPSDDDDLGNFLCVFFFA